MKLSEKILLLRKAQGLSQEALADKLQVSRQAVSRWEMGSALPDAGNLLQLSRLLGVTADYLLDEQQETYQPPAAPAQAASGKLRQILGLLTAGVGILGNFVFYLLSRFIEVPVPHTYYDTAGQKWYEWGRLTGYSYKYFLQEHHLELLTVLFWLLTLAGLLAAFGKKSQLQRLRKRFSRWKH